MNIVGKRLRFFRKIDDTLEVFHTHLVSGTLGGFLTGIFTTAEGAAAFPAATAGGGITGNGIQIGWQLAGACFIIGWNVVMTSLICLFIKYVCRVPLRMSEQDLMIGDDAVHGEAAYTFHDVEDTTSNYIQGTSADEENGISTPPVTKHEVETDEKVHAA